MRTSRADNKVFDQGSISMDDAYLRNDIEMGGRLEPVVIV